jgi:hypothetical protein
MPGAPRTTLPGMRVRGSGSFVAITLALLAPGSLSSCGPDDAVPSVSMDYVASDLYAAPFPGEHLRLADGTIDVSRAPNPFGAAIVDQIHDALEGIDGFGTTSPIHFRIDAPIDPSVLPGALDSLEPSAAIALIDVDPTSPERGTRRSFRAHFDREGSPYAAPNLLTLLPTQGMPLRARTLYAAVLTDRVRLEGGGRLAPPTAMIDALGGRVPIGMSPAAFESFRVAIDGARDAGIEDREMLALTAFRTGDPIAVLARVAEATEGALEIAIDVPIEAREVFPDFCVFEGTIAMPVFQEGAPPYLSSGGAWVLDPGGAPIVQHEEASRIVFTLPRIAMPSAGFPTAVLVRTGAGHDRALVMRGVRDEAGAVITEGTGPALEFARAGFAGVSFDGPHGGLRNPDGGDEQFRVFNIQNPIALRDNVRQSAIELVLLARALDTMTFDASSCPGLSIDGGALRFDTARLALMGHSMGASIAPLAAAVEPRYRALILSGAGGSWIENIVHKELPIVTRGAAEALLRYSSLGRDLDEFDPVLGLLQWAGESADAQVYARHLIDEPIASAPRHVLMFQGIVDHYILPPIANALSLSLGADRGGPALDHALEQYTPIDDLLPLRGRGGVELPAAGNIETPSGPVTGLVLQHEEDGVEDGHEIVFQTEVAKTQYRCFLRTFAQGEAPRVPDPEAPDPACE